MTAIALRTRRAVAERSRPALLLAFASLLPLATGAVAVERPELLRPLLTLIILATLVVLAVTSMRAALVALFVFLPFLGVVRRLLIDVTGWPGNDPLLLVAPAFVLFLLVRPLILERRPVAPDRLSKLVLVFLGIALVQVANPSGGGVLAGLAGFLFLAFPLLWFFVGRELADTKTVAALLALVTVLAPALALYGIAQTERGLPSWDADWVEVSGYAALSVGDKIRAFGTFASAAEYAYYLGIALVLGLAFLLRGRIVAFAAAPLLAWALVLESSRGIVVLCLVTFVVLGALRAGGRASIGVLAGGLAAVAAVATLAGPGLDRRAARSGDPLIQHQVGGLVDPLDPERSTLGIHWQALVTGVVEGVKNPIGAGTAVTNVAGHKFGAAQRGTEADVATAFVSLGAPGGIVFILLFVAALHRVVRLALARHDAIMLAVAGALVLTSGQWLNGGYYAVAPLVWLLVGWVSGQSSSRAREAA